MYTNVFSALSATGGTTSAVGSYKDGQRVNAVRGGSWHAAGHSCQTGYRGEGRDGSGGYNTVGFRVTATRA